MSPAGDNVVREEERTKIFGSDLSVDISSNLNLNTGKNHGADAEDEDI